MSASTSNPDWVYLQGYNVDLGVMCLVSFYYLNKEQPYQMTYIRFVYVSLISLEE